MYLAIVFFHRKDHPAIVSPEQRVDNITSVIGAEDTHPSVAIARMLLENLDQDIQQKYGPYTDQEKANLSASDTSAIYKRLEEGQVGHH